MVLIGACGVTRSLSGLTAQPSQGGVSALPRRAWSSPAAAEGTKIDESSLFRAKSKHDPQTIGDENEKS